MAVTQRLQDATGVIATDELGNIQIAIVDCGVDGNSHPADGDAGYAKGCILFNPGADADDIDAHIIVNTGTPEDASFLNLNIN